MQPQRNPNEKLRLEQSERATHLAAARFSLVPAHVFDGLPAEQQAELIALYLIDCRVGEVQAWEQREEMRAASMADVGGGDGG